MRNEFSSKVFLRQETKHVGLKIGYLILGTIIIGCVLIKVIAGDFSFSDISGILFILFLISLAKGRKTPELKYGFGDCIIDYENDKMTITYPNISGGSSIGCFKETTVIRYEDIESIEYGKVLECFRIVAKCQTIRDFVTKGKEHSVILAEPKDITETFIYVLDKEMQAVVLKSIQKSASFIVRIIED